MKKIFFFGFTFLIFQAVGFGQVDTTLARKIIQKYELSIWKSAIGDIILSYDSTNSKDVNEISKNNNMDAIISTLDDENFNKELYRHFLHIKKKKVDLFTQIKSIDGEPITLKGISNSIKNIEKVKESKIDSIYDSADNDLGLNYVLDKKGKFIEKFVELISASENPNIPKELLRTQENELKDPYKALFEIARATNIFKREKSIATWEKSETLIKTWNKKHSDSKITAPPFPITDKKCIGIYKKYVKGEVKENICLTHLKSEDKFFFNKIKKIEQKYSKYKKGELPENEFEEYFEEDFSKNLDEKWEEHFVWNDFYIPRTFWDKVFYILTKFWYVALIPVFVIILFLRFGKNRFQKHTGKNDTRTKIEARENEVKTRENKVKTREDEVKARENALKAREDEVEAREGAVAKKEIPVSPTNIVPPYIEKLPPAIPLYSIRPYGNGFKQEDIFDDDEEKHYYIIRKTSDTTATFEITANADFQIGAAGSHVSILRDACEYENMPFDGKNGIKTLSKGELRREGDFWKITKKAKIKFF